MLNLRLHLYNISTQCAGRLQDIISQLTGKVAFRVSASPAINSDKCSCKCCVCDLTKAWNTRVAQCRLMNLKWFIIKSPDMPPTHVQQTYYLLIFHTHTPIHNYYQQFNYTFIYREQTLGGPNKTSVTKSNLHTLLASKKWCLPSSLHISLFSSSILSVNSFIWSSFHSYASLIWVWGRIKNELWEKS